MISSYQVWPGVQKFQVCPRMTCLQVLVTDSCLALRPIADTGTQTTE
jgi:hypothetical protein